MTFPPAKSLRDILVDNRDSAMLTLGALDEIEDFDPEDEVTQAIALTILDMYHAVAASLGLLDEESGGSRQHYIETGAYLLEGEAITS